MDIPLNLETEPRPGRPDRSDHLYPKPRLDKPDRSEDLLSLPCLRLYKLVVPMPVDQN